MTGWTTRADGAGVAPGLVVIGGSSGALDALRAFLPRLGADFPWPVALVVHVPPDRPSLLVDVLSEFCALGVCEVEDKQQPTAGTIHVAPPNYHVLVERRGCFSLCVDEPVNFSRPSIDVLFESAAEVHGPALVAVLLGGASDDGARGLARAAARGGVTVVQAPESASARAMPEAALRRTTPTHVLRPAEIATFLLGLAGTELGSP